MTIDILYNMKREMLRRKLSPRTVKTYMQYVKLFLLANKDREIRAFSKKDVREFLYKMEERGASGSTLNVAHNALRFMMIDILHKICQDPCKKARIPDKRRSPKNTECHRKSKT